MRSTASPKAELPILLFDDEQAWERWLEQHHDTAPGVWLQLAKKDSGLRSVSYAAALDVALCYGWIDGQKRSHDAESWLQKFTPRGPRSIWSKINVEKVRALSEAGRMKPAGLQAIEQAKASGRWGGSLRVAEQGARAGGFPGGAGAQPRSKSILRKPE